MWSESQPVAICPAPPDERVGGCDDRDLADIGAVGGQVERWAKRSKLRAVRAIVVTAMKHVVILGAGFAGLELATRLSESLAGEVRVTLLDQNDSFSFGFSKLDVLFSRKAMEDVLLRYADISFPGVEFRQERVASIDPEKRRVGADGSRRPGPSWRQRTALLSKRASSRSK